MTTVAGAGAQTIEIGFGPHSSITTIASGPSAGGTVTGAGANFQVEAADLSSGADLGSAVITLSVLASPSTLSIWVTETGVNLGPTPQKLSFLSGLTQNQLPAGATVTETTWFDASDTAYGTGTKLATETFTAEGSNAPGVTTIVDAFAPYSITEEYDVTIPLSTPPTALSTISLDTTTEGPIPFIPEPSTWIMMAIGFVGLGYAAYGRSRKSRAQASVA
jgi:hypothetical protein